jgi:hypothetical protein
VDAFTQLGGQVVHLETLRDGVSQRGERGADGVRPRGRCRPLESGEERRDLCAQRKVGGEQNCDGPCIAEVLDGETCGDAIAVVARDVGTGERVTEPRGELADGDSARVVR